MKFIKFFSLVLLFLFYYSTIHAQSVVCDSVTNVSTTDNLVLYGITDGPGYVSGHSPGGYPAIAEKFTNSMDINITQAAIRFGAAVGNPNSSITVAIWAADGGNDFFGNPDKPGSILASQQVSLGTIINDVAEPDFTWVTFSNPPNVTGDYFIGVILNYIDGDTVGIVTNTAGETIPSTSWTSVDNIISGEWSRTDSLWSAGGTPLSISNLIFSIYCIDCPQFNIAHTATGNTSCSEPHGTIDVSTFGGNEPYTYTMNDSSNQIGFFENLEGGDYVVHIQDNIGCKDSISVNIEDNTVHPLFETQDIQANSSCVSPYSGSITFGISDGTTPYQLLIDGPGGFSFDQNFSQQLTGELIDLLANGTYRVTVSDANGCQHLDTLIVENAITQVTIDVNGTDETTLGAHDGTAEIEVIDGDPPFTYAWSNGENTASIDSLSPGTYSVTVTDANGCNVGGSFEVLEGEPVSTGDLIAQTHLSVYPNPSTGIFNIEVSSAFKGPLHVEVFNLKGEKVAELFSKQNHEQRVNIDLGNQANGIYLARIKTGNEVIHEKIMLSK